ncbi:hypothetical protein LNV47_22620 [Paucibacter sp. DJ4R-1]|nr:hypothetical protein [Paucibacter sp. DJ4R-1]
MRVISSFLPSSPSSLVEGGPAVVMAFDTLVDEKSVVVGITVGRVNGPQLTDLRVSAVGQQVIDRCAAHHQLNYPQGVVVVAGVAQVASAKQRTRDVLAKAPPQALVLLVCADGKVYDAAFTALGVDLKSMNVGAQ